MLPSQTSSSASEITNQVIARETLKKEAAHLQQEVWNQRILFSDLKKKFPTLHHNPGRGAGHCAPILSRTHSLTTALRGPGRHAASSSCPNPITVHATRYSNIMRPQLKKMQPPTISSVRISSSGSMRPPVPPTMPAISTHVSQPITESPTDPSKTAPSEGSTMPQDVAPQLQPIVLTPASISRVKPPSQNQQPTPVSMNIPVIANGYHIPVAGFSPTISNSTSLPYSTQTNNILSAQQMQNIKMEFAEQASTMHQIPSTTRARLPYQTARTPVSGLTQVVDSKDGPVDSPPVTMLTL